VHLLCLAQVSFNVVTDLTSALPSFSLPDILALIGQVRARRPLIGSRRTPYLDHTGA
jgi:hypothetical protein